MAAADRWSAGRAGLAALGVPRTATTRSSRRPARPAADPAVALRVLGFPGRLALDAVLAIFDAVLAEARAALSGATEAGAARRARRLRRGLGTKALNTAEGSRVLRFRGTTGLSSRGRPALG